MKACTKCGEVKPLTDFYVQKHNTDGRTGTCKDCVKARASAWYYANSKYSRRRPWTKERAKEWYRARDKKRRESPEFRAAEYKRSQAWFKRNKDFMRERSARRCRTVAAASPSWRNRFFIAEAYRLAVLREKVVGGKWHVDHVVPLNHPLVCGLHVEFNLQVVPAKANIEKSNRHWPDMPT